MQTGLGRRIDGHVRHAWSIMQTGLGRRTDRHVRRAISGQGTTEYAILVGVLVVIAILAIVAFKGKVQTLWDEITNGMKSL